jgi:hypothetical protein
MLKSTSLWAGSEVQVEYCARARGAAKARMPVTIAKRFIVEFPFGAGPLGRFWVREEGNALAGCARGRESQVCSALNLLLQNTMPRELYSLQQILLNFQLLPSQRAKNGHPRRAFCPYKAKSLTLPATEAG